ISSPETEKEHTIENQFNEMEESYFMLHNQGSIKSYPNPVADFLVIEFIGEKPQVTSILVYDRLGRLFLRESYNLKSQSLQIDQLNTILIPGDYYVQVIG